MDIGILLQITSGAEKIEYLDGKGNRVMHVDNEELYKIANAVRTAMKNSIYDIPSLYTIIGSFPRGCCGYATEQVGLLLKERYPDECVWCINAQNRESTPHTWVEFQERIVDITPDQFAECDKPVIVCDKTQSELHSGFIRDVNRRMIQKDDNLIRSDKILKAYIDNYFHKNKN